MSKAVVTFSVQQERAFWFIFFFVLFLHSGLMAPFLFWADPSFKQVAPNTMKRIAIQTVHLNPASIEFFEEKVETPQETASSKKTSVSLDKMLPIEPHPATPSVQKPMSSIEPLPSGDLSKKDLPKPMLQAVKAAPAKKNASKKLEKQKVKPKEAPAPASAKKAVKKPEKSLPNKTEAAGQSLKKTESADRSLLEKKQAEQSALVARQKKLLSQAEEKIAKIVQNRDKSTAGRKKDESAVAVLPGKISSLEIEQVAVSSAAPLSEKERHYRDELASRLKLLLRLPEVGEVRIKLTLERGGRVAKLLVLGAESSLNRQYIEKQIPTLSFPPLSYTDGELQTTFSITLCNEI